MIGKAFRWLRRGWSEALATWRDARECGDWRGHLAALFGVLIGAIGADTAEWRP